MDTDAENPRFPITGPYLSLFGDWLRAVGMLELARDALNQALAPNEDLFLKRTIAGGPIQMEPQHLKEIVQEQLKNARTVSKAGLIVFTQALMDGHAYRCIRAVASVVPTARLRGRNGPLREELPQIERDPLMLKMDVLIELCRPPKNWDKEDRELLQQAIRLRNSIVHEAKLLDGIGEDDFDFACSMLMGAGTLALCLVDYGFGVQLGRTGPKLPYPWSTWK